MDNNLFTRRDTSTFNETPFSQFPDECFSSQKDRVIKGKLLTAPDVDIDSLLPCIKLENIARPEECYDNTIVICSPIFLTIEFSGSNNYFEFGENNSGIWMLRTWLDNITMIVRDNVTSNGVDCFLNPNARVYIGEDCMFSLCHINAGDNHAVFDMETKEILNEVHAPTVIIREHVWVGLLASVLEGSDIGAGSILATKSVCKGSFPHQSLLAGIPSQVKRSNVSWSRDYLASDREDVIKFLNSLSA